MQFLETLLSILLFIISLSALITIHEAGHLSMAKLFKVYCHEFSIGFGPALLHKRKEGKETYFSIRAIPLGGYVSMYGEDGSLPEDVKVPQERSLEGIKKWKKAIVLSAGVILNAVLALVLIGVSNIAFPYTTPTRRMTVEESSIAYNIGIRNDDYINYIIPKECLEENGAIDGFTYEYKDETGTIHSNGFFVVDTNVEVTTDGKVDHCVLVYTPTGNKGDQELSNGLQLYYAMSGDDINTLTVPDEHLRNLFVSWRDNNKITSFPKISAGLYELGETTRVKAKLIVNAEDELIANMNETTVLPTKDVEFGTVKSGKTYKFESLGAKLRVVDVWLPFETRVKNTFDEYGQSAIAVFRGLGILFTGGIKNLSGLVGIYSMSSQVLTQYTFAKYLSLWGLISINLAIFNLLPFPGLDGWQLLVTAVEGITRKKIPQKLKGIMSFIGLALLFALMVAIVVFDIIRIAGGAL